MRAVPRGGDSDGEFSRRKRIVTNRFRNFQRFMRPELPPEEEIVDFKKDTLGSGLKIMTPNQMHMRLPVALAQIKAGNNSKQLMNEVRQLLYSLYKAKRMTKKVYDDLMSKI